MLNAMEKAVCITASSVLVLCARMKLKLWEKNVQGKELRLIDCTHKEEVVTTRRSSIEPVKVADLQLNGDVLRHPSIQLVVLQGRIEPRNGRVEKLPAKMDMDEQK